MAIFNSYVRNYQRASCNITMNNNNGNVAVDGDLTMYDGG